MSHTLQLGDAQVDEDKLANLCRHYDVRELSLFGSAVRGEMQPGSDIDVMVEFDPDVRIGLLKFARILRWSRTIGSMDSPIANRRIAQNRRRSSRGLVRARSQGLPDGRRESVSPHRRAGPKAVPVSPGGDCPAPVPMHYWRSANAPPAPTPRSPAQVSHRCGDW